MDKIDKIDKTDNTKHTESIDNLTIKLKTINLKYIACLGILLFSLGLNVVSYTTTRRYDRFINGSNTNIGQTNSLTVKDIEHIETFIAEQKEENKKNKENWDLQIGINQSISKLFTMLK